LFIFAIAASQSEYGWALTESLWSFSK